MVRAMGDKRPVEFRTDIDQRGAMGGEGGMFGSGPGSDTYSDWFDENVAKQVSSSGRVGIAEAVLADIERHHQITPQPAKPTKVAQWRPLDEKPELKGGFDDRR